MLKKITSILLCMVLLLTFAVFPASAATKGTYTAGTVTDVTAIEFTTDNAKIVGRTNPANPFVFSWHASGVEFDVTGTSTVGIRISSYDPDTHWVQSLMVEIDGKAVTTDGNTVADDGLYSEGNAEWLAANPQIAANTFFTKRGTTDYILATDLDPNTTHTVRVVINQENWGQYWQRSVVMSHALVGTEETAQISKTADGAHKVIFYGDSITSAGSLGGVHNSYHYLTAKALNADAQVFSASGGLFARGYIDYATGEVSTARQISIANDWNYVSWYNDGDRTDSNGGQTGTAWTPDLADANGDGTLDYYETDPNNLNFDTDLIVINIGTNDGIFLLSSEMETNMGIFREQFEAFMDDVLYYYPDVTVMLTYGFMRYDSRVKTLYDSCVEEYLAAHPELSDNGNGQPQITTYYYTLAKSFLNDNHPDKYAHAKAAVELTDFIEEYMGWEEGVYVYPNNEGVLEEMPTVARDDNSLFLGFTKDSGEYVKIGENIGSKMILRKNFLALYDGAMDGLVDADGNENDTNPVSSTAEYINGFYVQGTQVRVQLADTDKETGLRFIVVNNTDIETQLLTEIAESDLAYERGVMVVSESQFENGELTLSTPNSTKVVATNIFASTTTLQANYDKYTACVIKIPEAHFSTDIIVRPYFKYTDNSGVEHVYYGEQYDCSLYDAALAAYNSGRETEEVETYLYENIIKKCKGDNDTELEW